MVRNPNRHDQDEISAALFQRTEELNEIKSAKVDSQGYIQLPVIDFEEFIVFPKMVSPIFIKTEQNLKAIQAAQGNQSTLILLIKPPIENKNEDKPYLPVGVEIVVGRLLEMMDGNYSALVQGCHRVKLGKIEMRGDYLFATAKPILESLKSDKSVKALIRISRDLFERCVQLDRTLPEEANYFSMNIEDPGWLADMITTALSPPFSTKYQILSIFNVKERLKKVNELLAAELDVLKLEDDIQSKVQREVDRSQREFYLREQVKAIRLELGEGDIWEQEIADYKKKIAAVDLPKEAKSVALKEVSRLSQTTPLSPELSIIRNYLDWIIDLPWSNCTQDNLNVNHASRVLKKNHFGLEKAKERLLEYIAVKSLKPNNAKQPILCFVGPPGTGKTSLGKSMAEALQRKFVRLSLGGIRDEAEIRGHRRTYIGALPGRILQTMKRAGTINPLFMLDEVDKLGKDFWGDPAAALLEVLDPEQNHAFSDHYLEMPFNLSQVMFITTANTTDPIPSALLDRMEIIEFPGYIEEEKIAIAKKFLVPKQIEENGLAQDAIIFSEEILSKIIREYTYEAGVRNLEREIGKICRKISRFKSQKKKFSKQISAVLVEKYLGPPQFFSIEAEKKDEIGVATAVAWTENGGEIMPVEVLIVEGKGNLQITGQVGDIMRESAQAALSYIKSKSRSLKLKPDYFEKVDVHIHIPEGAIPKDGPSAGVTIAIALFSAFGKRKVYSDIGLTGEITLRGNMLPIGGIKVKVLAAHRAGLKRMVIPKKNRKDLSEVPRNVQKDLEIITCDNLDQVIKIAVHPSGGR